MTTYMIVRHYRAGGRCDHGLVIRRGLTLSEARSWFDQWPQEATFYDGYYEEIPGRNGEVDNAERIRAVLPTDA